MSDGPDPLPPDSLSAASTKAQASPDPSRPDDEPLRVVLARLVETGRAYADAELDRQKLRAAIVGSGLRTVALLVLIALIVLFGTLVTLMLGLVLALSPLLTPAGATVTVALASLMLVAMLLIAARNRLRALFAKDGPQ